MHIGIYAFIHMYVCIYTCMLCVCILLFKINFFIFGCVGSSLLCAGFLQLRRTGATLRCSAWASHCSGFSCCGAWALGAQASVVVARGLSSCGSQALEHSLSSCGARVQLLHGIWDLPGPGLEPVSPALAGRFLTTAPPEKSCILLLNALPYLELSRQKIFDKRLELPTFWQINMGSNLTKPAILEPVNKQ